MQDISNCLDGVLRGPSGISELELSWERRALPMKLSLLSLTEVTPGVVWALGVERQALGSRGRRCDETVLLSHEGGRWRVIGKFKGRLILVLERGEDGAMYAAGEGACYRFDGGRWHDLRAPEVVFQRLWAPSEEELYALGSGELFYFDGRCWHQVDLVRAYGAEHQYWSFGRPSLSDIHGTCEGEAWVVGTWFTHSTMLAGRRLDWRRDGCPSWYLYRVRVFSPTEAIAVGGDGIVALRGSRWGWYSPSGRSGPRPRAFFPHGIARRGDIPLVTGFSLLEQPPQVCVWVPDRWYRAGPKVPIEQQTQTTASILTSEGDLLVADYGATWRAPLPDPAGLISIDPLVAGAPSDEASVRPEWDEDERGEGTNVGDLWADEDTIPDGDSLGLSSGGEPRGDSERWHEDS